MTISTRAFAGIRAATLVAPILLSVSSAGAKTITQVIDATGDGAGHPLSYVTAIAANSSGSIFVSGFSSNNVLQRTSEGMITEILDASGDGAGNALDGPHRIAVDTDDTIYVAGYFSLNVFKGTPEGGWTEILDATGDGAGHVLSAIDDIKVDSAGNLYVSDEYGPYVFRVTPAGAVNVVLDASGDGAGNTFSGPSPLAIDADDNLYVASRTDRVFRVSPAGTITMAAVDNPSVRVRYIEEIAIDNSGNLLIGDNTDQTLIKVTPGGVYSIISHNLEQTNAIADRGDMILAAVNGTDRRMYGFRPNGPRCTLIDNSGDGIHPFGFPEDFVVVGTDPIYLIDGYSVYRIDHACEGPSVDASGRWFVATTSNGVTPAYDSQEEWVQSGLSLTVSNPDTAQVLYTGNIDDSNRFSLSRGSHCGTFGCCPDVTYSGQIAADGLTFSGGHGYSASNCRGGLGDTSSGSRCGNENIAAPEACDDGNATSGDGCDSSCGIEPCNVCTGVPSVCQTNIRSDCAAETRGGATTLTIKQGDIDRPGKLKWRVQDGQATSLGNPTTATDYALCMFDVSTVTPSVVFAAAAPAGPDWTAQGDVGFRYRSDDAGPDGIASVKLRSTDSSKVTVTGKGPSLDLPPGPLALPMKVQLQTSDAGCFESSYSPSVVINNDADGSQLRADP